MCLAFIIDIYVIIQNNDVIPVSGLTISVALLNKDNGVQIGDTGVITMGRLNAGESANVNVPVMYNINSLSLISSTECVIVLRRVISFWISWIQEINVNSHKFRLCQSASRNASTAHSIL